MPTPATMPPIWMRRWDWPGSNVQKESGPNRWGRSIHRHGYAYRGRPPRDTGASSNSRFWANATVGWKEAVTGPQTRDAPASTAAVIPRPAHTDPSFGPSGRDVFRKARAPGSGSTSDARVPRARAGGGERRPAHGWGSVSDTPSSVHPMGDGRTVSEPVRAIPIASSTRT